MDIQKETENQHELLLLCSKLEQLQATGHFSRCYLQNLKLLPTTENQCWNMPALMNLMNCWDCQFSPEKFCHIICMCIEQKDDFDVLRDGKQSINLNVQNYTISTTLYQETMLLEAISGAQYSLMNIWLSKKLWHLCSERSLCNKLCILKDTKLELSANFAPAETFVDIHIVN
ncbi:uncharacterized protein CIMG_08419 [Coccidioides immitis RS]|uniref:Uncharacterized protein n=1 Tax=Coccidioides immitis (strain RS) TaxID=246410 RepID=J3K5G9_COCIM|nr:uncharacterized protein CIMG_08419 [Coccidioides immitis RS]EAS29673.3 hypothetical protein CIMG_08419 [Coccidioides immitis RS]